MNNLVLIPIFQRSYFFSFLALGLDKRVVSQGLTMASCFHVSIEVIHALLH